MISKFLAGGALAVVAMVAVMLVTLGSPAEKAEATVHGLSLSASTINATSIGIAPTTSIATIDVDGAGTALLATADEVNILLSTGTLTVVNCIASAGLLTVGPAAACTHSATAGGAAVLLPFTNVWVGPNAIGPVPVAGDLDTILATITAPTTGPSTIAVTAIQGTSVKTASVKVRGTASEVVVSVHTATNGTGTAGNGIIYKVLPAGSATVLSPAAAALPVGQVVANVKDSAGTNVVASSTVFTTTAGTITNLASTTNSSGNAGVVAAALTTIAGNTSTGIPGAEATITASTGGKSGTTTVKFGGDPSACTIAGDPATTAPGTTSLLTGSFTDSSGGPIPDGVGIAFATVNAVTGSLAIVGTSATSEGAATTNLLLGAPGGVAIAAAIAGGSIPVGATFASLSCQNSIIVTGQTVPPTTGGGDGDGAIVGDLPSSGFGLVTFGGSIDELTTALGTSCASGAPIFATSGGAFVGFFPTTSLEAPNAAFKALFSAGIPASTPLLGGNC